jgi:PAS domain S-box-containing protein
MGHIQIVGDPVRDHGKDQANTFQLALMKVLFISNNFQEADLLQRELIKHDPPITIDAASGVRDALIRLNTAHWAYNVVLLDTTVSSADAAILAIAIRNEKKPIGLAALVAPTEKERPSDLLRAGLDSFISKRAGYAAQLGDTLLYAKDKAFLKSREERLRQIVEILPAGIAIIAPDGTFLAINRAGLSLMGAARSEQIVGKNILHLLPAEERERILTLLATISGWNSASTRLNWKGLDGSIPGIEIRAVPMRREGVRAAAVLVALFPLAGCQSVAGEFQKKCDDLTGELRESQARRLAAEEQQAKLKGMAEHTAARFKLLLEEQCAERANWEQSRQILKEQCAKIETIAQSLGSAQAALAETHYAEQEQWKLKRQELEQKLEAAETRSNQLSEALRAEHSQMDLARQELEQLEAACKRLTAEAADFRKLCRR